MTTLLLSSRHTEDNQALWRAATQRGWNVERVQGIRVPEIDDEIVLYVEALFAPTVAKSLGLRLLDLAEDWLVSLPQEYRRREVTVMTLGAARKLASPSFVKPPNDTLFTAKVHATGESLPTDYDDDMTVLVAEPVEWEVEFRCFALDRTVRTLSPYLRSGELSKLDGFTASDEEFAEAGTFAELVLSDSRVEVPKAVVVDVGKITGKGWAVVEANGAWGSGIYGCDPDSVLDVVRYAVRKELD